jgi:hypothetical protein
MRPLVKGHEVDAPAGARRPRARPGRSTARRVEADITSLQRLAGNEAVTSLLSETSTREEEAGATHADPLARVAATAARPPSPAGVDHLRSTPAVQRQGAPAAPTAPAAVTLGSITVSTYSQLLSAERFACAQLGSDARQLPEGEPARTAAEDLIGQARSLEPMLQARGDAPLDQTAGDQANLWYQEFVTASKNVDAAGKAAARSELQRTDQQMGEALDSVQAIPDDVADLRRAAFLKRDDSTLETIQRTVGGSLIAASAILDAREKVNFMMTKLTAEESRLSELIEHYAPMVEAAHKVVSSLELLQKSFRVLRPEGTTELDKEMNQARSALDAAVAATSLIPEMGLYTAYVAILVSVATRCIKFIADLVREQAHMLNQLEISQGHLNDVDWSAEPGGRPAFDFMVLVMHAEGYYEIPSDIPEAVDELITDSEDEFTKGTGQEVPTKGFWFWKHANPKKIRQWLFTNRQAVWAMLYGSTTPL